ncbi:MAG: mannose-1-phosphate guanylyltransferase/mannose-6-phosphate isomerase [Ignavibacteriales bacterium]
MKIIILAGGGGTRLFPLSRTSYPKQFLKIGSDKTLLTETIQRFLKLVEPKDIIVVTNNEYYYHVKAELKESNAEEAHIILENVPRNTAPAIALAARYCIDELGSDMTDNLLISPSDHLITSSDVFIKDLDNLIKAISEDKVVTMGVKPDKPETGYGYIKIGESWRYNGFIADKFVEKPDIKKAEKYLKEGKYYWNSGMYAFSINTFVEELSKYQTEIYDLFSNNKYQELSNRFSEMPNISIDYAIAEKSKRVVVIPISTYWSDIGSWDAIYDAMQKDDNGNVANGLCLAMDCSNSLLFGDERLIVGIGLEDTFLIETDDVVLVAKKGESQKVKDLVDNLKKRKRKEATEHTTGYRPWGNYKIITEGPHYKVKKITVYPGHTLSLQMHYHRSEHWIVIGGTAKVTIGQEERFVSENESIFIPKTTKHRLENPGTIPLEIIEVQSGSFLSESDIVRFEDIYGRI